MYKFYAIMEMDLIQQTGLKAATKSAEILLSYFGNITRVKKKGEIDLVTIADTESEKIIIHTIKSQFPNHSILAEESGLSDNPSTEYKWIIDPLDGTTNFAHGLGLYAVSIAFAVKDEIHLGIVYNPTTGELFSAVKGQGARLNGKKIHVSKTASITDSLIVTGFPYNFKDIFAPLMTRFKTVLSHSQGVRRLGSAALDLCYVASSRFDGFWEQNLKPWDTAAGSLIVSEAGGTVTNFSNSVFNVDMNEILATNGSIHKHIVDLLEINE